MGRICELLGFDSGYPAYTRFRGCSIAVNGVCLTVTAFDETSFTVGLAPET